MAGWRKKSQKLEKKLELKEKQGGKGSKKRYDQTKKRKEYHRKQPERTKEENLGTNTKSEPASEKKVQG